MTKLEQADEIDWIETNKALAKEIIELKKQAEQEPVAWVTAKESFCGFPKLVFSETQKDGYKPLYAATVRTKDLTDAEIHGIKGYNETREMYDFAHAVIRAYKEKQK